MIGVNYIVELHFCRPMKFYLPSSVIGVVQHLLGNSPRSMSGLFVL